MVALANSVVGPGEQVKSSYGVRHTCADVLPRELQLDNTQ